MVEQTAKTFGRLDVLVNNGAFQHPNEGLDDITDEIFEKHFRTNVFAPFYLTKAAIGQMKPGGSVIITGVGQRQTPDADALGL